MELDYATLLKRGREHMPASVYEKERLEIPKARGHLQGNKTIISNFSEIASMLRRQPEHLLKYILKELAAPGDVNRSGLLIIGSKISAQRINEKIKQYTHEFVFCPTCGKPDTDLKKEGDYTFLVCSACGTKTTVKSKI